MPRRAGPYGPCARYTCGGCRIKRKAGDRVKHATVVLILFVLYTLAVVAGVVAMAVKKRKKYLPELLTVYFMLAGYVLAEAFGWLHTPPVVIALVFVCVLTHTLVGEFGGLYHSSTVFDRWLHLAGAFTFALFLYAIINHTLRPPALPRGYLFVTVACVGTAAGSLFELAEFFRDLATQKKRRLPSQHGLKDTDTDLLFNTAGALLAGAAALFFYA